MLLSQKNAEMLKNFSLVGENTDSEVSDFVGQIMDLEKSILRFDGVC